MTYASSSEVLVAIRSHFNPREYVVLPQVRDAAGFDAKRTADCLVIGTWPSRGLPLYGVEIKVSLGDWLREKDAPEKADAFARFCDYWVLIVGDENIVKDGEVPLNWGLLVPGNKPNTLKMKRPPAKLSPQPISNTFLAAILKRASEFVAPFAELEGEIKRRVSEEVAIREEKLRQQFEREYDRELIGERLRKITEACEAFRQATGERFDPTSKEYLLRFAEVYKVMQWEGLGDWLRNAEAGIADLHSQIAALRASLPSDFHIQKEIAA